jgi:hypothetical protein
LQSLGQQFFRNGMIVEDQATNQRWLKQIHEIIERVRVSLGDYRNIAAEEDKNYQEFSPFLNQAMYDTPVIEFDLREDLPETSREVTLPLKALRWLGISAKKKVSENLDAWKWALFQKRDFEVIVRVMQDENKRLKDLLPLMPSQTIERQPSLRTQNNTTGDTDADDDTDSHRLGLATHAQLRQILQSNVRRTDVVTITTNLVPVLDQATGPLTMCKMGGDEHDIVLVEYKPYQDLQDITAEERGLEQQRVRQLASLLTSAGTGDLATLTFRGLSEDPQYSRHTFVFDYPPHTDTSSAPLSLFDMISLNKVHKRLDLPTRFSVAATLAKAIATFHADGWVHKSLRSESVVFFREDLKRDLMIKNPYLVNFEYSRPQASHTLLEFDDDYERNLYRHPDRQGQPTTSFNLLHDIYALGVVLLEIGLWQTAASMMKEVKVSRAQHMSAQSILRELTKRRLSHHMGPKYAEAVLACIDDRFSERISDVDFPMIFHDEVINKIDIRALLG